MFIHSSSTTRRTIRHFSLAGLLLATASTPVLISRPAVAQVAVPGDFELLAYEQARVHDRALKPLTTGGSNPDLNKGGTWPALTTGGSNPDLNKGGTWPALTTGGSNPEPNKGGTGPALTTESHMQLVQVIAKNAGTNVTHGKVKAEPITSVSRVADLVRVQTISSKVIGPKPRASEPSLTGTAQNLRGMSVHAETAAPKLAQVNAATVRLNNSVTALSVTLPALRGPTFATASPAARTK